MQQGNDINNEKSGSNDLLILKNKTDELIQNWERCVDDYGFIRFYFNGIVKEFRQLVSNILQLWDTIDEEVMGAGIGQIKDTVRQQIDAFQNTMPHESSFESVRDELELKHTIIKNKMKQFSSKLNDIDTVEARISYRTSFNNDIELEINKAKLAGRDHKNFLSKMGNDLFLPIKSFLEFSEMLSFSGADSEHAQPLDDINEAAQNFSLLLNDYKVFKTITENPKSLRTADFNFENILNKVIEKYSLRAQLFGINLFYKLDNNIPTNLVGNAQVVEDLLCSLLENALNVVQISNPLLDNEGGKINLAISVQESQHQTLKLRIAIEDSGIGFPSNEIKDAFNFFSLYSEVYPFAAFKLKLCQDIVEHLNGKLYPLVANDVHSFVADVEFVNL